ncbi:hypothetical protein [Thermogemmatispora onikobensis]|uniref:hypothetical protein n=1 Tax=Thermogemmatispora onikobensis TaxID=732234 RepID=UPI000853525A|nr:hypothetical protein [Thermogemmatispora onikobensis]
MRTLQRIEGLSGAFASLLGLAGLLVVIFAPLGTYGRTSTIVVTPGSGPGTAGPTTTRSVSLVATGISATAAYFLAFIALVILGIGISAIVHSQTHSNAWRAILWLTTALLLAGVVVAILSVGPFLLPSLLLALVASVLAGLNRPTAA